MNKKLTRLIMILVLTAMAQSAMASGSPSTTTVFSNTGYEAIIKSMTGATYDSATSRISVTDMVSFVNWLKLNIPAGKSLDYFFSHDGQISVNTVETGMSRFAGTLSSSGAKGRIIISNPNGVLMEGTSVVNANSLLLTTHGVSVDGSGNVTLTKQAGTDGSYYGVAALSGARMTLADNLTIVSNGIDVVGANITAGNDIKLVTTDGATYVAGNLSNISQTALNPSMVKYVTKTGTKAGDVNSIKIASTSFKTTNGKIYLIAKNQPAGMHTMEAIIPGAPGTYGDISVTNVTADGDVVVDSANNVTITNGDYKGNLNIAAAGNATLTSTSATTRVALHKDLTVNAGGDVSLVNTRIIDSIDQKATITGRNVTIKRWMPAIVNPSSYFDLWWWDGSILGDTHISASGDVTLYETQIQNNLVANAAGNINFEGALVTKNATLTGTNITIANGITYKNATTEIGFLPRIKGNLDATATQKITLRNNNPSTLISELPTATNLTANEIEISNFGFKSANINADNVSMVNTTILNDLAVSNFNTFGANGLNLGGNLSLTNGVAALILDSTIGGNATLAGVQDAIAINSSITKDLSVSDFNIFGAANLKVGGNSTFSNGANLALAGSKIGGNMGVNNTNNWNMTDTDITGVVTVTGPTIYTGRDNTADGQTYPLPQKKLKEAATYVNRLATGSAPNVKTVAPAFTPKGFAAADQTDYKEQFLRKDVKKASGNIVTTNIFKAE